MYSRTATLTPCKVCLESVQKEICGEKKMNFYWKNFINSNKLIEMKGTKKSMRTEALLLLAHSNRTISIFLPFRQMTNFAISSPLWRSPKSEFTSNTPTNEFHCARVAIESLACYKQQLIGFGMANKNPVRCLFQASRRM